MNHKITNYPLINKRAAEAFIERADAIGLKGRARDREALSYWLGIGLGCKIAGEADLAEHFMRVAGLLVARRGYSAIVEMAAWEVDDSTLSE